MASKKSLLITVYILGYLKRSVHIDISVNVPELAKEAHFDLEVLGYAFFGLREETVVSPVIVSCYDLSF